MEHNLGGCDTGKQKVVSVLDSNDSVHKYKQNWTTQHTCSVPEAFFFPKKKKILTTFSFP